MIQPQVWVSVLSTIMDALTVLALAEGTTIYFWRQAGRGTTVRIPAESSVSGARN